MLWRADADVKIVLPRPGGVLNACRRQHFLLPEQLLSLLDDRADLVQRGQEPVAFLPNGRRQPGADLVACLKIVLGQSAAQRRARHSSSHRTVQAAAKRTNSIDGRMVG